MYYKENVIERCQKTGKWIPAGAISSAILRNQQSRCNHFNTLEIQIAYQNQMNVDDLRKYLLRSQGNVNKRPF